jgi:hypothetical protein
MKLNFAEVFFGSIAIVSYVYMEILYFRRVRPFLRRRHIDPEWWANNFGRFSDYRKAKKEVAGSNLKLDALNQIRILFFIYIFSFIGLAIFI